MLLPPSAFAADYPTRSIRLIVGFTPGASSDIVARLYAKGAGPIIGQEMIVENKTGAGSSIAAEYVARAAKDGYTLFVPALSTLTYKIVHPEARFDMTKDFAPVALLAVGPLVMVVDPKLGVNSVQDFTALAKSMPGQILFGTVGPGSLPDLAAELYAQRAGVKLVQVPYPGSPQITTDLIGSRITMSFQIASVSSRWVIVSLPSPAAPSFSLTKRSSALASRVGRSRKVTSWTCSVVQRFERGRGALSGFAEGGLLRSHREHCRAHSLS